VIVVEVRVGELFTSDVLDGERDVVVTDEVEEVAGCGVEVVDEGSVATGGYGLVRVFPGGDAADGAIMRVW
jgi:hypothetical protein